MGWPRRSAKEGHRRAVFQEYINNTAVKAHPRGRRAQAEPIKLISDKFASHHRNFQCFSDRGGEEEQKKKRSKDVETQSGLTGRRDGRNGVARHLHLVDKT